MITGFKLGINSSYFYHFRLVTLCLMLSLCNASNLFANDLFCESEEFDSLSKKKNELIVVLKSLNGFEFLEKHIKSKQCVKGQLGVKIGSLSKDINAILTSATTNSANSDLSETDLITKLFDKITTMNTWAMRTDEEIIDLETRSTLSETTMLKIEKDLIETESWKTRADFEKPIQMKIDDLTKNLTDLQNRIVELDGEIARLEDLKKLANEGTSNIEALKSVIEEEIAKKTDLENSLNKLQSELNASISKALIQEIEQLENLLEELIQTKELSTSELAKNQTNKTNLEPRVVALNSEFDKLKEDEAKVLKEINATSSIVVELDTDFERLKSKEPDLRSQENELTLITNNLEQRLDQATEEITGLQSIISKDYISKSDADILEIQIFALQRTIEEGAEEIDDLSDAEAAADGRLQRFLRACKREPDCKDALNL